MTVSYFALYRTPEDPAAFEQHYFGSHVPLVERTPGLLENRVHRVTRQFVGEPAWFLLAELVFESPEAMKQAFRSEDGLARWWAFFREEPEAREAVGLPR